MLEETSNNREHYQSIALPSHCSASVKSFLYGVRDGEEVFLLFEWLPDFIHCLSNNKGESSGFIAGIIYDSLSHAIIA